MLRSTSTTNAGSDSTAADNMLQFSAEEHAQLDVLVLDRLTGYGSAQSFNAVLTLVAIVKTCDALEPSLGDPDEARKMVHHNPWFVQELEAAFVEKSYKVIRDRPILHRPALKIEALQESDNVEKLRIGPTSGDVANHLQFEGQDSEDSGVVPTVEWFHNPSCDACQILEIGHCERIAGTETCAYCTGWDRPCTYGASVPRGVPPDLWSQLRVLFKRWMEWEGGRDLTAKLDPILKELPEYMAVCQYIYELNKKENPETSRVYQALKKNVGGDLMFAWMVDRMRREGTLERLERQKKGRSSSRKRKRL
ncbi:hypothetical protein CALCODRAFT_494671 [Calocera cornea HHB12733]|uniref:Uncharacterized protein n=1 Tax=Calocera cornea HHB12733 TaxID=1353952 RepID=A0A165GWI6_9BASI|nr:hypothetical protein CALCODRAFT_494671 [Calocera cornea HHB12733]